MKITYTGTAVFTLMMSLTAAFRESPERFEAFGKFVASLELSGRPLTCALVLLAVCGLLALVRLETARREAASDREHVGDAAEKYLSCLSGPLKKALEPGLVFGDYACFNSHVRKELEELRDEVKKYCERSKNESDVPDKPYTVFLWGPSGSGKSFLAKQLFSHVYAGKKPTSDDCILADVSTKDTPSAVLAELAARRRARNSEKTVPFIVIDEIDSKLEPDTLLQHLLRPAWDGEVTPPATAGQPPEPVSLAPCVLFCCCSFRLDSVRRLLLPIPHLANTYRDVYHRRQAAVRRAIGGRTKGTDFLSRMLKVICLPEVEDVPLQDTDEGCLGADYESTARAKLAMMRGHILKYTRANTAKASTLAAMAGLQCTSAREMEQWFIRSKQPMGSTDSTSPINVFSVDWLPSGLADQCEPHIESMDRKGTLKGKVVVL